MTVIKINQLDTKINNKKILSHINLSLDAGKILALVGHNGAGKTTLIKTIIGILDKSQGDIILNEIYSQEKNLLDYKMQINYLPEEPLLLSEFTVMQHFQMYGMSYAVDQSFFDQEVARLTSLFNLNSHLDAFPEELSKGMRQKVQTICALIPQTPLLLIDEPFMGLDIYAMEHLVNELKRRVQNGLSVILTTHQLKFVKELADEFILLEHGQVIERGDIEDFKTISAGHYND